MNVSSISASNPVRMYSFIRYANSFLGVNNKLQTNEEVEGELSPMPPTKPNKINKNMGIETLTIFPKEIIDGKTVITA